MNRKAMRKKVKHPQVKERTRFRVSAALVFINAFFIIVSAAFILISMWINSEKNLRDLSRTLINEIQQSVSTRTHSYFAVGAEVNKGLSFLLYHFFENPVANERDGQNTFKYYGELMNIYPQFKMLYYSDTQGNLIMLNRMADGSHSRRFVNNTGDYIRTRWEHHNPAYYSHYPNSNEMAESGYDPRRRIWYRIAQEAKELVWTPVYLFATDHLPGFTCAAPVFDNFGNMIGVSSVDIAVNELSRFLAGVQPTPGTRVFILDKENNLVAIQAKKDEDFEKLFEKKIDQYGGLTYNIASLDVYPDDTSRIILKKTLLAPEKYTRITHQGSSYISMISLMSIGNGLDLNIGIIIPENDIIGNMRMNMRIITMFSGAFLVLIVLISGVISRAIARPMRILSEEMAKIKTFNFDSEVNIKADFEEIKDIRDSFENMRTGLRNFKRYVPSDIVANLLSNKTTAELGGEQRELTMFFSDINKFTNISENAQPDKLVHKLCEYFDIISKTIVDNKGTIDKYIGDSVMAFWGAPSILENHAAYACYSAIIIRDQLHALARRWNNKGEAPFATRIGINSGDVIVGNMGSHHRLNYTVIGDAVNLASRLEGMNKVYSTEIIVSESTHRHCRDKFEFRLLDRVTVRGRKGEVYIYELICVKDDIDINLKKIIQHYETGMKYYFSRRWQEALKCFATVVKYRPGDMPSKQMHERCLLYLKNPPPENWNGVFETTGV